LTPFAPLPKRWEAAPIRKRGTLSASHRKNSKASRAR